MVKKQKIKDFIRDVTADNSPVESKPIIITKKDMQKNCKSKRPHKKRKHQPTGFICDDFEILI